MTSKPCSLAFITSAYNEELNIEEFYNRCHCIYKDIQSKYSSTFNISFSLVVADNGSTDGTLLKIQQIINRDSRVICLANSINYGVEPSVANLLSQSKCYDIVILLCSDLQDPPELAMQMVSFLLDNPSYNSVLATKQKSKSSSILSILRPFYYNLLDFSSRRSTTPTGYHGFGCYRQVVILQAVALLKSTNKTVRQCLSDSSTSRKILSYTQHKRLHGNSSYHGIGYLVEAGKALLGGDALISRLSLLLSAASFLLVVFTALALLINFLKGTSGYSGGIPTLMAIILTCFTLQMMMFFLISRQIEIHVSSTRRTPVRFSKIVGNTTSE
jgi:glucosyltransferase